MDEAARPPAPARKWRRFMEEALYHHRAICIRRQRAEAASILMPMSREELAAIAIGITLLSLGGVSIAAATLRLRRSSTTLVTFGLWCAMYGARLLAGQPGVRTAIGGAPTHWRTFAAIVTYTINVPISIFVVSLIGAGWRRSAWWLVTGLTAFAVIGIASDLTSGRPA